MLQTLVWISLAGAIGTLFRYGLGTLVQRLHPAPFAYGTLLINILGCLVFGFIWSLAEKKTFLSYEMRVIVLVGFMGAFTTFSTYAFETAQFLKNAQSSYALLNIFLQNFLGIVAIFLGMRLGR